MDVLVYITPYKIDGRGEEVRDEDNIIKLVPHMKKVIMQVASKTLYVDVEELQAAADICIRSLI